jgi:hypothetical protein
MIRDKVCLAAGRFRFEPDAPAVVAGRTIEPDHPGLFDRPGPRP